MTKSHESIPSPVSVPEGDAREIARDLIVELGLAPVSHRHFDVAIEYITAALLSAESRGRREGREEIDFYEREFYPLSNFSAFTLMWPVSPRDGLQRFDTSEAVYHWEKFKGGHPD